MTTDRSLSSPHTERREDTLPFAVATPDREVSTGQFLTDLIGDVVAGFIAHHPNLTTPWRTSELEFSEDCDVLSDAFTAYCHARGLEAETVCVKMSSPLEAMLDIHYFNVVTFADRFARSSVSAPHDVVTLAIDWTARQFYNCDGMPLNIDDIDFPLVFAWPGDYPLPTLTATAADPPSNDDQDD